MSNKKFSPDMQAANLTPAFPTHPGAILKDESIAAFKQIRAAAEKRTTPELTLDEINAEIRETRPIRK